MRRYPILLLATLVLLVAPPAGAQEPAADPGWAPCSDCHDTVAATFHANPHAAVSSRREGITVCESCHGDGDAHAESGDPSLISVPRGDTGARACLSCHTGAAPNGIMARGAHGKAGVQCDTCHQVHQAAPPRALLKRAGSDGCVSCHQEVRTSFQRPFRHRLDITEGDAGAMTCVDCHNPHGDSRDRSLKSTHGGEIACLACHTEMRGPFVYPHVTGVAGDCRTCHEPHGSSNPRSLVRASISRMCLECHTTLPGDTLGSMPPSFHDLRSPRFAECTTCHVAVHGSNSSPGLLR